MTAILGGGLAGLTAAYHCIQNPAISAVTLLEASPRLGGWIRSRPSPSGAIFEQGPRTVRVAGQNGQNTLQLLDRLRLKNQIIPVNKKHPASYNRMIFVKNQLVTLPKNFGVLFDILPPFSQSFIKIIVSECLNLPPKNLNLQPKELNLALENSNFAPKSKMAGFLNFLNVKNVNLAAEDSNLAPKNKIADESVDNFVRRRFGAEVAEFLVAPIIAGIFAGDSKCISMKAFARNIWEAEREYGSVLRGLVMKRLRSGSKKEEDKKNITVDVLMSDLVEQARKDGWSMWTLKGGLEVLPTTLAEQVTQLGVQVQLNSPIKSLSFKDNSSIEISVNGKSKSFQNIISALPAWELAKLVKNEHKMLADELESIPSVDVAVVNLEFEGQYIEKKGFGFLVAPIENRPILGVIFDSCLDVTVDEYTTLTVMMGGAWYDKYLKNATEEDLLSIALSQLKEIMKIEAPPIGHRVSILRRCIAQYSVGHVERVARIRDYIKDKRLPLSICGSSYDGVGINDVIMSGKMAAEKV